LTDFPDPGKISWNRYSACRIFFLIDLRLFFQKPIYPSRLNSSIHLSEKLTRVLNGGEDWNQ